MRERRRLLRQETDRALSRGLYRIAGCAEIFSELARRTFGTYDGPRSGRFKPGCSTIVLCWWLGKRSRLLRPALRTYVARGSATRFPPAKGAGSSTEAARRPTKPLFNPASISVKGKGANEAQ